MNADLLSDKAGKSFEISVHPTRSVSLIKLGQTLSPLCTVYNLRKSVTHPCVLSLFDDPIRLVKLARRNGFQR